MTKPTTYKITKRIYRRKDKKIYVFRGMHLRLNKEVVFKAENRNLTTKSIEQMRSEADLLKELSHTYIPVVYDCIVKKNTVFTVMDYIKGEALDVALRNGEKFSPVQVIEWGRQLLDALIYLHGYKPNGIIHSDIKPANIIRTIHGHICLIDFNISLSLDKDGAASVGLSPGYASPEYYGLDYTGVDFDNATGSPITSRKTIKTEINKHKATVIDFSETVIDNGTETKTEFDETVLEKTEHKSKTKQPDKKPSVKMVTLDARSDIYCLGATMYHLLTGKCPPRHRNKQNREEYVPPSPLSNKEYSPALAYVINKAMNPNIEQRYQSAAEMLYDLNHLRELDPRYKRFRFARSFMIASNIAMICLFSLISFVGLKQSEMLQKSFTLSEYSANALADGDVSEAIKLALEALPEKRNVLIPPYTAKAKVSLTNALGVYDLSDSYKSHSVFELPSQPFKIAISEDGRKAVAVYAYEIVVFDTDTMDTVDTLKTVNSALADVCFLGNDTVIYAGEDGITAYDIYARKPLWTGETSTYAVTSADFEVVASTYISEDFAVIYDKNGNEKGRVNFGGRQQSSAVNQSFANPLDNLFVLSGDGEFLAMSFSDGSLSLFNIKTREETRLISESDFFHFEGGFYGNYFSFSASGSQNSVFAIVDTEDMSQTGGFESDSRFGVIANESGVYISNKNLVVEINPETGEQSELAFTTSDVVSFSVVDFGTLVSTKNNECIFFDKFLNQASKITDDFPFDFISAGGESAVVAGRNSNNLRILKYDDKHMYDCFRYDADYYHDEAAVNDGSTRLMLYSHSGFRIYDEGGTLINETDLPDAELIYDQQYSRKSGNLAVMYSDALRIYSGNTGELLYEKTELSSVFYAPYGVSINGGGSIVLVDVDEAKELLTETANAEFAAYCGKIVDSAFLGNYDLIGSGETENGYFFATGNGESGSVYDGDLQKLFEVDTPGRCEAFITEKWVVISPLHGIPIVYDLKTGKKISELEKDAYLTYTTEIGEYVLSRYINTEGEQFGVLLNSDCESVARLPWIAGINNDELVFDYKTGVIRKSPIYSIGELKERASEVLG